jgi:hypothetical protein
MSKMLKHTNYNPKHTESASRQPDKAEIGQDGGYPIGRAGRLTSLVKSPSQVLFSKLIF